MSAKLKELQELVTLLLDDDSAKHTVTYEDRSMGDIERGYYCDVDFTDPDDPRGDMPSGYGHKRDSYHMKVLINGDYLGYSFAEARQTIIGWNKDRIRTLEGSELHLKQRLQAAERAVVVLFAEYERYS